MPINATIIGRLGRDPDLKTTGSGRQVCSLSIASDHGFGDRKSTTWVRASVWGKAAENAAKYLRKGSEVAVQGVVYTREHDGKTYVECDATNVTFIGARGGSNDDTRQGSGRSGSQDRGNSGGSGSGGGGSYGGQGGGGYGDEIPFK